MSGATKKRGGGAVPTRTATVSVRMQPETVAAANRVAMLTMRSVSGLAEYALLLYIQKNYPLAMDPNARLVMRLEEAPAEGGAS